ncbi:hypothetical protein [Agrobacterium vitis]|uniref:hypothetical protein n=1 Tax=Agrobacterium vitis TaxID=373 RepID=UPI0008DC20DA|nr:hypothetical protein [Agrobacterium vitis]MUO85561.1 hypothetical protein [Agrobacterium vitis]
MTISIFQAYLIVGALVCALFSMHMPRAWIWICAGVASFALSTWWARSGFEFPPAFTLLCDATVSLSIYFFGRERWEDRLADIFRLSVFVSLVYLTGPITVFGLTIEFSHYAYVTLLELINWLALILIGGTAVMDRVNGYENGFGHLWSRHFHRSDLAWRKARVNPPFTKVWK